ncbi:DUF3558 domain-containing protein [Lentzea atacamensis]|uniref:DUF3558 domain-containing protein n=1 Tax=Lentzea atacamensis TaxID=531938 RepID=UPI0014749B8C|nr:DUF3558 domain-containing protein [Lentzea atacamensis]
MLICAAAVSACTIGGEKGSPTTAAPTTGSSGKDSANGLPARPSNLNVDSVDPCKLFTTDIMKQIGVHEAVPRKADLVEGEQSSACRYSGNGGFGYTVGAVTHKGVSYWIEGSGNTDGKVIKIADFGAVEITLKGGTGFDCSVAIDVAENQQLMISYIPTTTSEKQKDQSFLCENAEKAAGYALATLKTLK